MNRDIADQVTQKILADMARLGSNWTAPWVGSGKNRNFVTMKPYKGVNVFITGTAGFNSPFFGSYAQWSAAGAQILKGSKATHVVFYKPLSIKDRDTDEEKTIRLIRTFPLFNQEQTDGKGPELRIEPRSPIEAHEECDRLIRECGIPITHQGDKAFYSPSADHITLPKPEQFTSREGYYGTALHECGHGTGHASRLDRKLTGKFGSPDYSFEEMIVETAAALVCVATGITKEPREDHAKYLNSWMRGLKSDSRSILQAFSKAQAAADWILGERPGATPEPTPARPDAPSRAGQGPSP